MKVEGVRMYGAKDLRLEEFEMPEIKDDEVLLKVMSDSICMSTWKEVKLGSGHIRVPDNIAEEPVLVGHELLGTICKVGRSGQMNIKKGTIRSLTRFLIRWGHLDILSLFWRGCYLLYRAKRCNRERLSFTL